jgi:putative phosphoesterase
MKIGIISDTHDHVQTYGLVGNLFKDRQVEMIIHCGDWISPFSVALFARVLEKTCPNVPIQGVFGNNDGDIYRIIEVLEKEDIHVLIQKDVLELELGKRKIAVYHGTEEVLVQALLQCGTYDAVFRGHTHVPVTEMVGKTLHVNPGTVSSYSQGNILKNVSVAIYDSETNQAELVFFPRQ